MILCKSWTTQGRLCPRQTHLETKALKSPQCHPSAMCVHPCPMAPARRWVLIRKLLPLLNCTVSFCFIIYNTQISLITSQCKSSDKKAMWMESFVNIQEIMSKSHNKFLRNENSELQSQVNWKATCQGRNKGGCCCVHGNYFICKLCSRAELTTKRIQQCKPSLLVKWRKHILPKTI